MLVQEQPREQAIIAKKRVEDFLIQNIDYTIGYTDDSALQNPGPCGAGAALFIKGHSRIPIELERPVSKMSHSYHGELQALDLCLTKLSTSPKLSEKIIILSDCQSALLTSASPKLSKKFAKPQIEIQSKVEILHSLRYIII